MTKAKVKKAETQTERKKAYKDRAKAAHEKMPFAWINSFVTKYPEYANMKTYVTNVARGSSYDEALTVKLEEFVGLLQPDNK
jgi:hypothetical protein